MAKTIKEEKIDYIKRVIGDWGSTSVGELSLDHSPCVNSLGDGDVCELIEYFNSDSVETVIYDRNDEEIDWNNYLYGELSDDIIAEIEQIMQEYDADMTRTEKHIQS